MNLEEQAQPVQATFRTVEVELPAAEVRFSLLDQLTSVSPAEAAAGSIDTNPLREFLQETSVQKSLSIWLGSAPGTQAELQSARLVLARDIARVDRLLSAQVNAILHKPEFQSLESAWRGLQYLWKSREQLVSEQGFNDRSATVEIRIIDVSKRELKKDFEKSSDFDQNSLFKKVY